MGTCLDKSMSEDDSGEEHIIDGDVSANTYEQTTTNTNINISNTTTSTTAEERPGGRRHHHHSSSHRHNGSGSSSGSQRRSSGSSRRSSHNNSSSSSSQRIPSRSTHQSSFTQSLNTSMPHHSHANPGYSLSSSGGGAGPMSTLNSLSQSANLGNNGSSIRSSQVYYLTPNVQRTADQLTEEEQIKLLKRMALIQQLPSASYDENKKNKECVICMIDFELGDTIKCLPCMHSFHQSCIDAWLVRSLICPSCMEPVDAGLLAAYDN